MSIDNLLANPRRPETRERADRRKPAGDSAHVPRVDPRRDLLPPPAAPGEEVGESGADLPSERVMPEMPGEGAVPRDFRITQNMVEKFGPTDNCPGCRHALDPDTPRRVHNRECRKRMEGKMRDDPS